jgi:hypothetical protein
MDESTTVTMHDSPTVTMVNQGIDHGKSVRSPWAKTPSTMDESPTVSINRFLSESLSESDQRDGASKDAGVDQTHRDVGALKTALEDCRRAVRRPAGEDGDSAVKLADAVADWPGISQGGQS